MEISVTLDLMYRGNFMYYIEQENEELVKYEVELDKESLEKFKN